MYLLYLHLVKVIVIMQAIADDIGNAAGSSSKNKQFGSGGGHKKPSKSKRDDDKI